MPGHNTSSQTSLMRRFCDYPLPSVFRTAVPGQRCLGMVILGGSTVNMKKCSRATRQRWCGTGPPTPPGPPAPRPTPPQFSCCGRRSLYGGATSTALGARRQAAGEQPVLLPNHQTNERRWPELGARERGLAATNGMCWAAVTLALPVHRDGRSSAACCSQEMEFSSGRGGAVLLLG